MADSAIQKLNTMDTSYHIFKLASFQLATKGVEQKRQKLKICTNKGAEAERRFGIYCRPQQEKDHQEEGLMNHSFQS